MNDVDFYGKKLMRSMAWERAKGELHSISQTFIGEQEQFENFEVALDEFITKIEENGWAE
jgi:hypothetical protein